MRPFLAVRGLLRGRGKVKDCGYAMSEQARGGVVKQGSNKANEFPVMGDEPLRGVFSTLADMKIGFGGTKRTVQQNVMFYVVRRDDGSYDARVLNDNFVPTGEPAVITYEELLLDYIPEPGVYHEKVYPAMRELAGHIARGEKHRERGETWSAEFEFQSALAIDEQNVRATFGLGLTYLAREDSDKAREVFTRLIDLPGAFDPRHKHMFNEFGIRLRKNRMFCEALLFYARAVPLAPGDDHLLYNIARTFFDRGDYDRADLFLCRALVLNPRFEEGARLRGAIAASRGGAVASPAAMPQHDAEELHAILVEAAAAC